MEYQDPLANALKKMESLNVAETEQAFERPEILAVAGVGDVKFHTALVRTWAEPTDGGVKWLQDVPHDTRLENLLVREKARAYARAGKLKAAIRELEAVKNVYNSSPQFWLEYAEAQVMALDFRDSLDSLDRAVSLAARPVYAYILIDTAQSVMNRYDKSLEASRKALKINPAIPFLYYRMGRACAVLEDFRCSIRAYRNIENIHVKSLYQSAEAYFALGEYRKAVEYYNRLLRVYPNYRLVLMKVAETYLAMRKYGRAEEFLRRQVNLTPRNTAAYTLLGNALYLEDKPKEALGPLNKALEIAPTLPRAHELRAKCYLALGLVKKAEKESRWVQ